MGEETSKESEKLLKLALEASEEGLWDLNLETGDLFLSPRVYAMLDYQPREIPATLEVWKTLLHPEDRHLVTGSLDSTLKTGKYTKELEFRLRAKNGAWRWVLSRGRITELSGDKRPLRLGGTLMDTTEKRRITDALKASESRYRNLFNNTYAMMMLLDPDSGMIVDANPAACLFYGYTRKALTGKFLTDISALDREQVFENLKNAAMGREKVYYSRHRLASGEKRNVEVYAGPIESQGRRLLFAIVHDITGRQRTEALLKTAEEKFFTVFQTSPEIIIISTLPEGLILEVNQAYTRVSGFAREEVLGKLARDLDVWVDWQERDRIMRQVREQNSAMSFEARFRGKGQAVFHGHCSIAPMQWAGQPCLLWIALDITSRKRAEEDQKERQENFRQVLEMTPAAIAVAVEGKYIYVNRTAVKVLGAQSAEQVLGRNLVDFLHQDFQELHRERVRKIERQDEENDTVVIKVIRLDGREAIMESKSRAINYNGRRAMLITGRDITVEKQLEELLKEIGQQKK